MYYDGIFSILYEWLASFCQSCQCLWIVFSLVLNALSGIAALVEARTSSRAFISLAIVRYVLQSSVLLFLTFKIWRFEERALFLSVTFEYNKLWRWFESLRRCTLVLVWLYNCRRFRDAISLNLFEDVQTVESVGSDCKGNGNSLIVFWSEWKDS